MKYLLYTDNQTKHFQMLRILLWLVSTCVAGPVWLGRVGGQAG